MTPVSQPPPQQVATTTTIIQQAPSMDPSLTKKLDKLDLLDKLEDALFMIEDLKKQLNALRNDHEDHKTKYGNNKALTDRRLDDLEKALKNFALKNDVDRLYGNIKEIRDELDQTSNLVFFFLILLLFLVRLGVL